MATLVERRLLSPSFRVLVVDDNEDAADSLSLLLESEGFETAVARSGLEALQIAAVFLADAVLLDLNMPGLDGFATAHRLAQQCSAYLVALSADDTAPTRERIRHSPFQAHLVKPASLEEIVATLSKAWTADRGSG